MPHLIHQSRHFAFIAYLHAHNVTGIYKSRKRFEPEERERLARLFAREAVHLITKGESNS